MAAASRCRDSIKAAGGRSSYFQTGSASTFFRECIVNEWGRTCKTQSVQYRYAIRGKVNPLFFLKGLRVSSAERRILERGPVISNQGGRVDLARLAMRKRPIIHHRVVGSIPCDECLTKDQ